MKHMRHEIRNTRLITLVKALVMTLVLILPGTTHAKNHKKMAVVDLSTIYMRQKPDYESPLETQELMGTVVEIVGEKSYWREVVTPQPYRAWCTDQGLVEMSEEELIAAGVPGDLVRFSCGLESKEDLIADIAQALESV